MSSFQQTRASQEPQHCSAGQGWAWISQAWGLFKQVPGAWIAIMVVWFLIQSVANLLPIISLAMAVLSPVFTGGILMAIRKQESGAKIGLADLFAGFKSERFGPLVLLGLFSILLVLGAVVLVALVFALLLGGVQLDMEQIPPAQAVSAALLLLVLMLPVLMALWFATSLVALHELKPAQAFLLSFRGCMKNLGSLSVFSLALIPLALLAMIPFGLGFLVLGPVAMIAMYRAYIEIFRRQNDGAEGQTHAGDLGWPE